jgi:archaellum biogenesis ATPase FlaH
MSKQNVEYALDYLNFGWSVIPIKKGTKESLIKWKDYQHRKAKESEIKEWFRKWPDANIAIVTGKVSNLTVIDVDPRHGGSPDQFLKQKQLTLTVNTGGGGKHFYYRYNESFKSTTSLRPGIDVQNDGKLVTAPPSLHQSRQRYKWSIGPYAGDIIPTKLPEIPQFVFEWSEEKKKSSPASGGRFDYSQLEGVSEGSRNASLASIIGKFARTIPPDQHNTVLWDFVLYWSQNKCNPPMDISEVRRTYISIINRAQRSKSQEVYNGDKVTELPESKSFSFMTLYKRSFSENKWLVTKLIPENSITCIVGKPKVGKSFISMYLALCIAKGKSFVNVYDTNKESILFISKEDPERLLHERAKQLSEEEDIPIYFWTDPSLHFDSKEVLDVILAEIKEKNAKVLLIDSFRRIFKGNENSSETIAQIHYAFKKIQELGVTIIFIHHIGKENKDGKKDDGDKLRGSSDILAMTDSVIMIERKSEGILHMKQTHFRDDKPAKPVLVKFPNFERGERDFNYMNEIEPEKDKQTIAQEDIMELLKESDSPLIQTEIIKKLEGKDYGDTTVKNALKFLCDINSLSYRKVGNKKEYFFPEKEPELLL